MLTYTFEHEIEIKQNTEFWNIFDILINRFDLHHVSY